MGRRFALYLGLLVGSLGGSAALANPVGPQVVNGSVSITRPAPANLTVTNTPNAIINWQGFSIAAGETTRFVQQSAASAVLNRVVGGDLSSIQGRLLSNGRVFLINTHGIVFGSGAIVNTAGLIASTLDISDQDFLAGKLKFMAQSGAGAGGIQNQGWLHVGAGGALILVAPDIKNSGIVETDGGKLVLAAGRQLTITSLDSAGVEFQVQAPADRVLNLGSLLAHGGAASVFAGSIQNKGLISADTVSVGPGGQVTLSASHDLTLAQGSTVSASNSGGGNGGSVTAQVAPASDGSGGVLEQQGTVRATGAKGGSVALSADNMLLTGTTDASGSVTGGSVKVHARSRIVATSGAVFAARGGSGAGGQIDVQADGTLFTSARHDATGATGGRIDLLGGQVELAAASADASGSTGNGGAVRVGGGSGGGEGLAQADTTIVNAASALHADAGSSGNGGSVVVYAKNTATFAGSASVRGGTTAGDGGTVELSAHGGVDNTGTLDLSAPAGQPGQLVLDPTDVTIVPGSSTGGLSGVTGLLDPNPVANSQFGKTTVLLGGTHLLVLDPSDNLAGTNSGAAYVFDTGSGALLSELTGAAAGDKVGSGGAFLQYAATVVNNSNYTASGNVLVLSPNWNNSAGAVTYVDSSSGFIGGSGSVGPGNSLVGGTANDQLGSGGTYFLDATHYLVISPNVTVGGNAGAGAITFGTASLAGAAVGTITSAANTLLGSAAGDKLGSGGVYSLSAGIELPRTTGGNALVLSPNWHGGAGAVTFVNAAGGFIGGSGTAGAANSLVGNSSSDDIGSIGVAGGGGPYALSNGNYLVLSPNWNGGTGAVTFANVASYASSPASSGLIGVVGSTAANTLIGSAGGDELGSGGVYSFGAGKVINSNNGVIYGNALVMSSLFGSGGTSANALGAVTYVDSSNGFVGGSGTLGQGNSLVGVTAGDQVGSGGVYELNGGNSYLVLSPNVTVSAKANAGAITFATASLSGAATGQVTSAAHTLLGGHASDALGSGGVYSLTDGTRTPYITIASGSALVLSPSWNSSAGAVTYVDGTSGFVGGPLSSAAPLSASNSLVGGYSNDRIGIGIVGGIASSPGSGIYALNGGTHYLVLSPYWNGGMGAITFGTASLSGAAVGTIDGTVNTAGNTLVGGHAGDQVGSGGVYSLSSGTTITTAYTYTGVYGNVLVESPSYTGPTGNSTNAGALTYVDSSSGFVPGTGTTSGVLDYTNSLVGSSTGDQVGGGGTAGGIYALNGGSSYLVLSPSWGGGKGAITFANTSTLGGVTGIVGGATNTAANTLLGSASTDSVGSGGVYSLSSGTYYKTSTSYSTSMYGNALVLSPTWTGSAGAVTYVDSSTSSGFITSGSLGSSNSLVGASGDQVGSGGVYALNGGSSYLVLSPSWGGGKGAITFANTSALSVSPSTSGVIGTVGSTAGNTLVGTTASATNPGDELGSGGVFSLNDGSVYNGGSYSTSISGNALVLSPNWTSSAGALTYVDATNGFIGGSGTVDSTNSLVGDYPNDQIGVGSTGGAGSGIYPLYSSGNYLVLSPNWNGGMGAITFGNVSTYSTTNSVTTNLGLVGTLGSGAANNTLLGATASATNPGDELGSGGVFSLNAGTTYNTGAGLYGNVLVESPSYTGTFHNLTNAGALTYVDSTSGFVNSSGTDTGVVDDSNSLVGQSNGDSVGSGGIYVLNGGSNYLVLSPNVTVSGNSGAGAITFGYTSTYNTTNSGLVGSVGGTAANTLLGSASNDKVGSGGVYSLYEGTTYTGGVSLYGDALVLSPLFGSGGTAANARGAVTYVDGVGGFIGGSGNVGPGNSLVGASAGDRVGSGGVYALESSGNYLVLSPNWGGGKGAATFADLSTYGASNGGMIGTVGSTAANTLLGSASTDNVGSGGVFSLAYDTLYTSSSFYTSVYGNALLPSPAWGGGKGAVSFVDSASGFVNGSGTLGSGNSLVGAATTDQAGAGLVVHPFTNGNFLIGTPGFNGGTGALTFAHAGSGATGVISAATNSLVGAAGDSLASDAVQEFGNQQFAVFDTSYSSATGAVTVGSTVSGATGVVSPANSAVGDAAGDYYGSIHQTLSDGSLLVIASQDDLGGLTNSGRIDVISPNGLSGFGDVLFTNSPGASLNIGAQAIANFLDSGASLLLQANNDIIIQPGADILSTGTGGLTLQAGRDLTVQSNIQVAGAVTLAADAVDASGFQAGYRGSGSGDLLIQEATVSGTSLSLSGANVSLQGGSAAVVESTAGPVNITAGSPFFPGVLSLQAGPSVNSDALAIAEQGAGVINLGYGSCTGCNVLGVGAAAYQAFDPLHNSTSDVGLFAGTVNTTVFSGSLDLTQALQALLANSDVNANPQEDKDKRRRELAAQKKKKKDDESQLCS